MKNQYPVFEINSLALRLPFGKHEGKTIGDLIVNEPNYVEWLFNQNTIKVQSDIKNTFKQNLWLAK